MSKVKPALSNPKPRVQSEAAAGRDYRRILPQQVQTPDGIKEEKSQLPQATSLGLSTYQMAAIATSSSPDSPETTL